MDETVKRLGEELADAVRREAASEARVAASRRGARARGYDLRFTLDARVAFDARPDRSAAGQTADPDAPPFIARPGGDSLDLTDRDRQFLRSLRIAADPQLRIRGVY